MDGPLREVLRRDEDLASLDITLPEPIAAARELRKLFPDLPADLTTEDDLERELALRLGAP
jgi:negative regulator of sigma E activity